MTTFTDAPPSPSPSPPLPPPPSLHALARTTAIALVVAAIILITLVLPAEYAIDPLGTGRWLGLTEIASPTPQTVNITPPKGAALTPVQHGSFGEYPAPFNYDVRTITLAPYDYVEYKYQLERSATMTFAWSASAPLIQDFHGERAGGATADQPAEESYDKQNRQRANGTLTTAFTGIHGWYWENPGGDPITITLTSAGFYSAAVEIRSDRTRHPQTLSTSETLASVTTPAAPAASGTTR